MSWKNARAMEDVMKGCPRGGEMSVLGHAVDHRQDDTIAVNLGQRLDEVHGNIGPDT
jgi:hypothetical protein